MSAVVEAVSDAVSGVVDAVGDAVEWVGDTVSNVVDSVMDDPLKAVVQVAAVATGNAWALPVIEGVDVLEEGGDLGDALKAAAVTYAVQTGVSYAMDSFGATGATDTTGSGTTQFFDDGTSIQSFEDGSRLITDSAGSVSSVPAPDLGGEVFDPATLSWKPAADVTTELPPGVQPSGAETFPVREPGQITSTDLPATDVAATDISTKNVPLVEAPAGVTTDVLASTPTYDTMEQLLVDKGLITPDQAAAATAATDPYANLPESFGNAVAVDPNTPAIDPNAKTYDTMEDLLYDKGQLTDAQYKDLTGVAPVVDLSKPAVPMPDVSVVDAAKDLGSAVIDTIKENPWTSAAVIGGGLAATGVLGGDQTTPTTTSTPATKTYTYGPGAPINRTGLDQLWSAASKIYGGEQGVMQQLGIQPPQFQSNFQPLLGGAAPGAGKVGLGALGQGFSYTPMGRAQTFDISTLSPEQIVQLQDMVARKKQPGEGF